MIGAKRGEEGYCSLKDVHLAHYFSRAGVLRHLVQMGLVCGSWLCRVVLCFVVFALYGTGI